MSKIQRILVSGDVEGNFKQLYKRVETVQKKSGKFDLLLCVGDFFGLNTAAWEPYKCGQIKVPISTLVLGPSKPELAFYYPSESDGTDLCEGVTYLGNHGRFTGSSGLTIAYLSGVESTNKKGDESSFSAQDAADLTAAVPSDGSFTGVDILITSQWPKGVEKYASSSNAPEKFAKSDCIAELARVMRPRYHFAGLEGVFYERQPYRNHQVLLESARHTTRFIALANVANESKQKYLYAFSIVPLKHMDETELVKQPEVVTECPYTPSTCLKELKEEKSLQFFYDMNAKSNDKRRKKRGNDDKDSNFHEKKPRKIPEATGPCWFCLGSPEVEKHLVVSVGDKAYMALAKGGLVSDHVLILPVNHHQSLVASPKDVVDQIDNYKKCLRKMFKEQDKAVVFFERNFRTQHMQIQAVPVPIDCVTDIRDVVSSSAESEAIELAEIPKHSDLKQILADGVAYFYMEIPTGDRFLYRIKQKFPLQFGREVLCEPPILNMPERVDWKNCKLSQEEEKYQASQFKSRFKSYDFNFL